MTSTDISLTLTNVWTLAAKASASGGEFSLLFLVSSTVASRREVTRFPGHCRRNPASSMIHCAIRGSGSKPAGLIT
jgi:hypothetical protein